VTWDKRSPEEIAEDRAVTDGLTFEEIREITLRLDRKRRAFDELRELDELLLDDSDDCPYPDPIYRWGEENPIQACSCTHRASGPHRAGIDTKLSWREWLTLPENDPRRERTERR
jgi:hypothetical protein